MLTHTLTASFAGRDMEHPAIVLRGIRLYNHLGEAWPDELCGLIDTGASRSLLPKDLAAGAKLKHVGKRPTTGYDGRRTMHPVVKCSIVIAKLGTIPLVPLSVPVVVQADCAPDVNWMLLGRDFLNSAIARHMLLVDFQTQRWSVGESKPLGRVLVWLTSLV